jgi:hypothetical protein
MSSKNNTVKIVIGKNGNAYVKVDPPADVASQTVACMGQGKADMWRHILASGPEILKALDAIERGKYKADQDNRKVA